MEILNIINYIESSGGEVTFSSEEKLLLTDWIVIRHLEESSIPGVQTTLSAIEYQDLCSIRNEWRLSSNGSFSDLLKRNNLGNIADEINKRKKINGIIDAKKQN